MIAFIAKGMEPSSASIPMQIFLELVSESQQCSKMPPCSKGSQIVNSFLVFPFTTNNKRKANTLHWILMKINTAILIFLAVQVLKLKI